MHVSHELRHRAFYKVVILVNGGYKTKDCGLSNEGL
jgi:hypothetical protein